MPIETESSAEDISKINYGRNSILTIATVLLICVAAIAVASVIITAAYVVNRWYRGHAQMAGPSLAYAHAR